MRYDPLIDQEYRAIARALKFANTRKPDEPHRRTKWAESIRGFTGVAPSNARFNVDRKGRVVAHGESALSPRVASRCQKKLRGALDLLSRPAIPAKALRYARRTTVKKGKKVTIHTLDFTPVAEVWVRYIIHDNQLIAKAQQAITPTLSSFVAYSCALLATERWRKRLTKCVVCDRFFIALPRRGGPKPKTCRPGCAVTNRRAVNAKRQQRSRDQRAATRVTERANMSHGR